MGTHFVGRAVLAALLLPGPPAIVAAGVPEAHHRNPLPLTVADSSPKAAKAETAAIQTHSWAKARAARDSWSESNQGGILDLSTALNRLTAHLLIPRLAEAMSKAAVNSSAGWEGYGSPRGRPALRRAAAAFLQRRLFNNSFVVDPEHITITNGVGAMLEQLPSLLFSAGDVLLIPAPYFTEFDRYIPQTLTGVRILPVQLMEDGGKLTEALLDRAESSIFPTRVAGILITTPDNPTGAVYSVETLRMIRRWADARQAHIISDEIYGASVYNGRMPAPGYTSLASSEVFPDGKLGERAHVLWGVSKDLLFAGLRIGVYYSQSAHVNAALESAASLTWASNLVQDAVASLLSDVDLMDHFLEANKAALKQGYDMVATALRRARVPFVEPVGGMFVWTDLREFLAEPKLRWESEHALIRELFEAGLVLTPGQEHRASVPGWFRICFASVRSTRQLGVALQRLEAFAAARRAMTMGVEPAI